MSTINIGRALAFNALTTALAAAAFAYTKDTLVAVSWFGFAHWKLVLLVVFAWSFVFGLLTTGEAAKFAEAVKDTNDRTFLILGRLHSIPLLVGLVVLAIIFTIQEFAATETSPTCVIQVSASEDATFQIGAADCKVEVTE